MTNELVVLLGGGTDRSELEALTAKYGWMVENAADLSELRGIAADSRVVAILLDAPALSLTWDFALDSIRRIAPEALTIICHRFSERIEWPELAQAGAFHALPMPLDPNELRQSLAYVSEASRNRREEQPRSMLHVA